MASFTSRLGRAGSHATLWANVPTQRTQDEGAGSLFLDQFLTATRRASRQSLTGISGRTTSKTRVDRRSL